MTQLITQKKQTNFLAVFVVAALALQVVNLLVLVFQGSALLRLSRAEPPSLVQLIDGQAIRVGAMDSHLERTPETIRRFTEETMTMLMSWSGQLPAESAQAAQTPQRDPGVNLRLDDNSARRVATSTWQAGFALAEDFRTDFLRELARLTPQDVFREGTNTQVVLVILNLGDPLRVGEGRWRLQMVANLLSFRGGDLLGDSIPFNKEIFVEAVEAPNVPSEASPLAKRIYEVRQSGLEIYALRDLEREEAI